MSQQRLWENSESLRDDKWVRGIMRRSRGKQTQEFVDDQQLRVGSKKSVQQGRN